MTKTNEKAPREGRELGTPPTEANRAGSAGKLPADTVAHAAGGGNTAAARTTALTDEQCIRASMTGEQIRLERKLTCEAIEGAIGFGQQGTNPPPSDDHWLAPFWKIGQQLALLTSPRAGLPRHVLASLECTAVWLEKGNDPQDAARELRACLAKIDAAPAAPVAAATPPSLADACEVLRDAVSAKSMLAIGMVHGLASFAKGDAAPSALPPTGVAQAFCKGENCGATDGVSHSPECLAEYEAAVNGAVAADGASDFSAWLATKSEAWWEDTSLEKIAEDAWNASRAAVSPPTADERAAFEAWWVRDVPQEYREHTLRILKQSREQDGKYRIGKAEGAWDVWQAALASQAAAPASKTLSCMQDEIAGVMQQHMEGNAGVVAINTCALAVARHVMQQTAAPADGDVEQLAEARKLLAHASEFAMMQLDEDWHERAAALLALPAPAVSASAPPRPAAAAAVEFSYALSQHAERWSGSFDSIEGALAEALSGLDDAGERDRVIWVGQNQPIDIDYDSLAEEVIERIQEQAFDQVGEVADVIGPYEETETKLLSLAIKRWIDEHGQISCYRIDHSIAYGPGAPEYKAAVARLRERDGSAT
ncbi:hypothetical protein [Burkholderia gladioli]|uniref:hypothetical protein n=1 Tax=Burkholderia gladioli TaxID=28095 RepID=UPI0016417E7D|nr:hypothetical protein [Burkholderia gladioli]